MKILYALQGTGNGHVSRAREIVPLLQKLAEVDVFVSGENSQVELPFPITYRSKGLSFFYNKTGGLDYLKTFQNLQSIRVLQEIRDFPIQKYDLLINDFESISAYSALFHKKSCIGFGHQASFLSPKTPRPAHKELLGETVLKKYAPCSQAIGLHFDCFDSFIHKPVIRADVRNLEVSQKNHITVYLPHYHHQILCPIFQKFKEIEWHIFTRNVQNKERQANTWLCPIQSEDFLASLASSLGIITGAGFESPAEAIFLGKKVMAIPICGQYEQACNAAALQKLGVCVVDKIGKNFEMQLQNWLEKYQALHIDYPDNSLRILENIVEKREIGIKTLKIA